jgi:hypothetical protein
MTPSQWQAILNLRRALELPVKGKPGSRNAAGGEIRYLMKLMRKKYAESQHNVHRCEIKAAPVQGKGE